MSCYFIGSTSVLLEDGTERPLRTETWYEASSEAQPSQAGESR
jgi:hypothetical protein